MHVDWKWGHFHFKAPWCYQICISTRLYYYRHWFVEKLGQNHHPKLKKNHFQLMWVAQYCLCLSSLLTGHKISGKKLIPWPLTEGWMDYIVIWWTYKEKWNSLIYFDSEPVLIQRISDCFLFIWNEKNIMKIIFNIAG